jgi:uncharacterized metal-binding protein
MTTAKKTRQNEFSCSACGLLNCFRRETHFPKDCLTSKADEKELNDALALYRNGGQDSLVARAAAEIEGAFYGRLTRVEEIIELARRIKSTKIGIATCIGLIEETRIFTKIL